MKTHNADGSVSAYGLAFGYVERREAQTGPDADEVTSVTLWHEHGCYHVRAHRFGPGGGRIAWDAFPTLKPARERFRLLVSTYLDNPASR